jgi:hypothetical protein
MAKVDITFPKAEALKRRIGLQRKGPVQTLIDTEVIRLSDPYTPVDTTYTKKSVWLLSDIGSGRLTWHAYYTKGSSGKTIWDDDRIKFQDAPLRGNYWVLRAMKEGGYDRLQREIGRILKR